MERKQYIEKLSNQLKEWDDKIVRLEQSAQQAKENVKAEYEGKIFELKNKKQEITGKLKELNESNKEAFEELKQGLANSFNELGSSIESAIKKYTH